MRVDGFDTGAGFVEDDEEAWLDIPVDVEGDQAGIGVKPSSTPHVFSSSFVQQIISSEFGSSILSELNII